MAMPRSQKDLIRQEFTRQARSYAATAAVADPDRVGRLVAAVNPPAQARVLEVATGPGYVAMGFALACRAVVGADLTLAPLLIAERQRQERGLENVRFLVADADRLPFGAEAFDVVVCRFAFHHFEDPPLVLREMTRVCRAGGTVAVEDLVVSEHPERADYRNRFENLRDPSHTRAYPLSALLALFTAAGLEIENVSMDSITPAVDRWLANAHTPPAPAAAAKAMIERDAGEDLSGARPYYDNGALFFVQRTAIVIGRRLRAFPTAG